MNWPHDSFVKKPLPNCYNMFFRVFWNIVTMPSASTWLMYSMFDSISV